MTRPEPNVVPREAAAVARAYVFENRDADGIDPQEALARILGAGHGGDLPPNVREKRLKTWVLQVLRRLRKHGWLEAPGPGGWSPTAALKKCPDPRSLARRAPRRMQKGKPPGPESWEFFIQEWVFRHRHSAFSVAEAAVAIVQQGFGTGEIGDRLDRARDLIEAELPTLQRDGLLTYDDQTEFWQPTDLLRNWPAAESKRGV